MITNYTLFADLPDAQLLRAVRRLAAAERHATAALVRALMEIDSRRLYLREGCSSLFTWCTQVLQLDEGAAYNRIEVARAARQFPVVLDGLEDGSLTLTAARLLAPHLTPDNQDAVLAAARHKSKRDIERLIAALNPQPDAPAVIRRLPAAGGRPPGVSAGFGTPEQVSPLRAAATDSGSQLAESATDRPSLTAAGAVTGPAPADAPGPAISRAGRAPAHADQWSVSPLAPGRLRLQITISDTVHEKLRRAQDLLRHTLPTGDLEAVLDRALTLLLEDLERRRFAATTSPRAARESTPGSRYIPAAIRRAVWTRDGGRCAFAGSRGRCTERGFLEFHHLQPYAVGGTATVDNLELRCKAHNGYEAALFFGGGGTDCGREARMIY